MCNQVRDAMNQIDYPPHKWEEGKRIAAIPSKQSGLYFPKGGTIW